MSHGIVVDHKESGTRFATLEENFDPATQTKVRDLRMDESITSYQPKARGDLHEPKPTSAVKKEKD